MRAQVLIALLIIISRINAAPLPPFAIVPAIILTAFGLPSFLTPVPEPLQLGPSDINITDDFKQPSEQFDRAINILNGLSNETIEPEVFDALHAQVDIIERIINETIANETHTDFSTTFMANESAPIRQ